MESEQLEVKVIEKRSSHRFTLAEKTAAVALVEAGASCKEVMSKYRISDRTLNHWRQCLSPSFPPVKLNSYTLSKKRSVIRAVEAGMSVGQVSIAFGISQTSIRKWVNENKAENTELSVFEMKRPPQNPPEDRDLTALKKQLAEAQMKIQALETLIDVAEEHLKIDIRKKSGARQSRK